MKHTSITVLLLTIVLAGCVSKSNFSLTFDQFTMKFYDNKKIYSDMLGGKSSMGMPILIQMKEEYTGGTSGFINSLIIVKTPVQTGIDMQTLVVANAKTLSYKLTKYVATENRLKSLKCGKTQYSGYITAFSYQLDNQKLFDGQYFFQADDYLYVVSLSADDEKDITSFIKSIGTIKCL